MAFEMLDNVRANLCLMLSLLDVNYNIRNAEQMMDFAAEFQAASDWDVDGKDN